MNKTLDIKGEYKPNEKMNIKYINRIFYSLDNKEIKKVSGITFVFLDPFYKKEFFTK